MDRPGDFSSKEKRQLMRAFGLVSQMAATAVGCVAVGIFLGLQLDRWLDTAPVFLVILVLMGTISAIKSMIDIAKKF